MSLLDTRWKFDIEKKRREKEKTREKKRERMRFVEDWWTRELHPRGERIGYSAWSVRLNDATVLSLVTRKKHDKNDYR